MRKIGANWVQKDFKLVTIASVFERKAQQQSHQRCHIGRSVALQHSILGLITVSFTSTIHSKCRKGLQYSSVNVCSAGLGVQPLWAYDLCRCLATVVVVRVRCGDQMHQLSFLHWLNIWKICGSRPQATAYWSSLLKIGC